MDCWKDGTRIQKSQTQSTCVGHGVSLLCPWNVPSLAPSWSLPCRNYLRLQVRCPCLGGAQLPKGPALGFVPRVVGRHPIGILFPRTKLLPSPSRSIPGKET